MDDRRSYQIKSIEVNGLRIQEVIIDKHYEEKHSQYMSDGLILELVKLLDGRRELPDTELNGYSYFATLLEFEDKQYRLIWLLEDNRLYVGIVNAYRDERER